MHLCRHKESLKTFMSVSEQRQFKKLRISLTDHCNLACTYCVEDESGHQTNLKNGHVPLRVDEFKSIIKNLHGQLNLETVRLTGGEPLLFKNIVPLISAIKAIGIPHVGLTTNGYYLKHLAVKLKSAGLDSINVSLDAIDDVVFKKMTRKALLKQTLEGIKIAVRYGFDIKINSVILKGMNESEIIPLLNFGKKMDIPVRFLELMKMGYLHHNYKKFFFSQQEILDKIETIYSVHPVARNKSATANYWNLDGHAYSFGIIANETVPFCKDCNRLRLDSYGNIYGCISAYNGISVLQSAANQQQLQLDLKKAMTQKQPVRFVGSEMSMQFLGG